MTVQERYDKLSLWNKFLFRQNPGTWGRQFRIEELELELGKAQEEIKRLAELVRILRRGAEV